VSVCVKIASVDGIFLLTCSLPEIYAAIFCNSVLCLSFAIILLNESKRNSSKSDVLTRCCVSVCVYFAHLVKGN